MRRRDYICLLTALMALTHLSVTTISFSYCFARFRDVCRVVTNILWHNRGASSTVYWLKFDSTVFVGRSRGLVAEEIVDLRAFRVILYLSCVVTLVAMHFGVLRTRDAGLFLDLVGWDGIWRHFGGVGRQAEVKLTRVHLFVGHEATHLEESFASEGSGCRYHVTRVEGRCILTLLICLLLGLLSILYFHFTCLLGRCFWPIAAELITQIDLGAVNFSAVNKRVGQAIGAGRISALTSSSRRLPRVHITAIADGCIVFG